MCVAYSTFKKFPKGAKRAQSAGKGHFGQKLAQKGAYEVVRGSGNDTQSLKMNFFCDFHEKNAEDLRVFEIKTLF